MLPLKMEVMSGQEEPLVSLYSYQETFIFEERDSIKVTDGTGGQTMSAERGGVWMRLKGSG